MKQMHKKEVLTQKDLMMNDETIIALATPRVSELFQLLEFQVLKLFQLLKNCLNQREINTFKASLILYT